METTEKNFQDQEFWQSHLLKAKDFLGTNDQYCVENGLAKSTFQRKKRELGFVREHRAKNSAFLKVPRALNDLEKPLKASIAKKQLPDPKWVAEFILALLT